MLSEASRVLLPCCSRSGALQCSAMVLRWRGSLHCALKQVRGWKKLQDDACQGQEPRPGSCLLPDISVGFGVHAGVVGEAWLTVSSGGQDCSLSWVYAVLPGWHL